jgi:hypothetical protein
MWLVEEEEESDLEMLDTAAGKLLWSFPMRGGQREQVCAFSPDGSLWSFLHGVDESNTTVNMLDVATGRILWERPGQMRFAGDTGMALHREDSSKPPLLIDARTGAPKATLPPNFYTTVWNVTFTPDGRHFLIRGVQQRGRAPYFWEAWLEKLWPDVFGDNLHGVLVIESATGRELFRSFKRDRLAFTLSEDASTLMSFERVEVPGDRVVIRVYDVLPTRAWRWAIGVAAGTAVVLFGLRRALRKFKGRAASTKRTPPPSAGPAPPSSRAFTSIPYRARFWNEPKPWRATKTLMNMPDLPPRCLVCENGPC